MQLVRLSDLPRIEASKIRNRQMHGTMRVHLDNDGYVCYEVEDYKNWTPRKSGRKPKFRPEK